MAKDDEAIEPDLHLPIDELNGIGSRPSHKPKTVPLDVSGTQSALLAFAAGSFAEDVAWIWVGKKIGEYLAAPDGRRHVWNCWFAAENAASGHEGDAETLHRLLSGRNSRDLIADAYGKYPAGLIRALEGCGVQARTPAFYRALVTALARDDCGSKYLRHTVDMPETLVLNIGDVPVALRTKPVFEAIKEGKINRVNLSHLGWVITRLESHFSTDSLRRIMSTANPHDAIANAFRKLPFPAPPWPGQGHLRPLSSVSAIRQVGRKLNNCMTDGLKLEHVTSEILREVVYFYEWTGNEPGLLQFDNAAPLGWVLTQGRGANNEALSESTWTDVEATLADWSNLAPICVEENGDVLGSSFLNMWVF